MKRAKFVVLDGVDGAGKDVQAERLVTGALERGLRAALLKFPVYDSITGRDITAYQRGDFGELETLSPRLIAYLYATNRAEAQPSIQAALDGNDLVVAARYVPSNVAYSAARVPARERAAYRQWVMQLDYDVLRNPREDAVIFLDLPIKLSEQLIAKRDLGRRDLHDENRPYRALVREQYHELAKAEPHWHIVDCAASATTIRAIDDIATEIETLVFSNILENVRMSSAAESGRRT